MNLKQAWNNIGRYQKPIQIVAIAGLFTVVLSSLNFSRLESNLYDFRISRSFLNHPDNNIILVALDHKTTEALDEFSPLSLDWHVNFLQALEPLEPKALGYVVDFNRVAQVNSEDSFWQNWSPRFVENVKKLEARGTVFLLGTPYDVTGEVLPPYPLSSLSHSLAVIHKDGNVFAEDKVTRRALVEMNSKPSFHIELAQRLGFASTFPRGSFRVPEIDARYFFFRYEGDPAKAPYSVVSFIDVLQGKIPAGAFKGKTVLVGAVSKDDFGDYAFTPYNRRPFASPKLQVHAAILDAVINQHSVVMAPLKLVPPMIFALTSIVLFWVLTYSPFIGFFLTVGLAGIFLAISQALFQFAGVWVQESQPLIAIFLGYYLTVPFRLVREHKARWEYQRKNELLVQVEELKTNFLSLVTHDLKTPVARIQGLAEVLQKKAADRLQERDLETLKSILGSTEELNHFISTILELSKVESRRMKLQPESKDINQLIEKSVETFKAPARARDIQIQAKLEPLFPVKMDVRLISKVINTLIDNAMKYSPNGTQITIESREEGDWVVVAVTDQGIGMSQEEMDALFTRFYRAKNDRTTLIAGTGLGLYLTKYFVEMHRGRVQVESEKGKGSTFKILLPLNLVAKT